MSFAKPSPPGKRNAPAFSQTIRGISKLAYRNLFHDRMSLFVTLTGIVFSVVLVAVQLGLYLSSERMITTFFEHARADLWVVPLGTKSFDDPALLTGRERQATMSIPGIESVEELVVGFASWKKPKGGATAVLLVGSANAPSGLKPWDISEGSSEALGGPSAVAIDRTYFNDLGIKQLGEYSEINNTKVAVAAVTDGIRSFTTLPYVFTTLKRARTLLDASPEQSSYVLVRAQPGANIAAIKDKLSARLKDVEILTHAEFRNRSLDYWLYQTGAGGALIAGAILGIVVGIVIVAQTLYASTKDHLNEFATLRALGAAASYIHKVILIQALLSAVLGYILGIALSLGIAWASQHSSLQVLVTPGLAAVLFGLTVGMCVLSAISAIFKVTRIDPAAVFSR
jgi:putative ABC transport system permease protein